MRSLLGWVLAALLWAMPAQSEPVLGDDGLHKPPWLHVGFMDLGEDLQDARAEGKHLLVLFEQRGCPYCRELHAVNFARPEIVDYLNEHFLVVQLDLWGAREVTDLQGEAHEERDLAASWGVQFTPTTVILSTDADGANPREVFRLPGYLKPFHYLSSLEYVVTGEHERQGFQRYLQDKFARLREEGIDPDVW